MKMLEGNFWRTLFDNSLQSINRFLDQVDFRPVAFGLFAVLLILFILHIRLRKRSKNIRDLNGLVNELAIKLASDKNLDHNLDDILEQFGKIVPARIYTFYLFDHKSGNYILKAVRHANTVNEKIAPSYSGLLPYKKEAFLPPVSVKLDKYPTKTSFTAEGKVPLLIIPFKGSKGFIYIGPLSRLPLKTIKTLSGMSDKIVPLIDFMLENDRLKSQVDIVVASNKAMHNISNILTDDESMLQAIIGMSIKTTGAAGAFFMRQDNEAYNIIAVTGMDEAIEKSFRQDQNITAFISGFIDQRDYLLLKKGDKAYYQLPSYFAATGLEQLLLIRVQTEYTNCIAGFWHTNSFNIEEYRINALVLLSRRLGDMLDNQVKVKELAGSYVNMLKILAQMLDNNSPYSIGYSELMYRYSIIIARELKLDSQEIEDAGIAAYLSNIGVLGLSRDLSNKEGRFSEAEYEMMKLHSDVGASIIEAATGNHKVALYVRHHHERMDGYGYPSGLKGHDIPAGARIIAVVQTFLAKINGRKDRDPLPFDKALDLLKSASGSQLDIKAVNALIDWFRKKQSNSDRSDKSIGQCWEMRCSPETICSHCSAYRNPDKNCWENKGVNCLEHGNRCETCYIYTEYQYRKSLVHGQL